jgi:hypothetical protein
MAPGKSWAINPDSFWKEDLLLPVGVYEPERLENIFGTLPTVVDGYAPDLFLKPVAL